MLILALLLVTLIAGGFTHEIYEGAMIYIETGSYGIKVGEVLKAYVWLPRGSYNVTIRTLDLSQGLKGVIVILASTNIAIPEILITETKLKGMEGFNLKANITLLDTRGCDVLNITFWRTQYHEVLKPLLRQSISLQGGEGICRLVIDTEKALGFLYITPEYWATMTIVGSDYTIAIIYGVKRSEIREGNMVSPTRQSSIEARLPETPVPLNVFKSGFYSITEFNYKLMLGLLIVLVCVAVIEYVSTKRGD